jgi:uncharacterized protein
VPGVDFFRDTLNHPTFDDWFAERTLSTDDHARIVIPAQVVDGNFDPASARPILRAAMAACSAADTRLLCRRERERDHETLVYDGGNLGRAMTLLGEPQAEPFMAVDAPDADVMVCLAEHRADGRTGATIPLTGVGHRVPAGSRLRLLASGSNCPRADSNPHTGEPIAAAVHVRCAPQTVFHDETRPSKPTRPVLT